MGNQIFFVVVVVFFLSTSPIKAPPTDSPIINAHTKHVKLITHGFIMALLHKPKMQAKVHIHAQETWIWLYTVVIIVCFSYVAINIVSCCSLIAKTECFLFSTEVPKNSSAW